MAVTRALLIASITFLVIGAALLGWSVAPSAPGFDAPEIVLEKTLTGPAGNDFGKTPFATLEKPGGRYRVELESAARFVVGLHRGDRETDAIQQDGSKAFNAGGETRYYWEKEFSSTIRSDAPASPESGPMHLWIKFPDASGASSFNAVATFTPTAAQPFIFLKAWSAIGGMVVVALGLILFLARAALPARFSGEH